MDSIIHIFEDITTNNLGQDQFFRLMQIAFSFAERPKMRVNVLIFAFPGLVGSARSLIMQVAFETDFVTVDTDNDATLGASEMGVEKGG